MTKQPPDVRRALVPVEDALYELNKATDALNHTMLNNCLDRAAVFINEAKSTLKNYKESI